MAEQSTRQETKRRMQEVIFQMLCDVDDFCRENSINYYLSGGSCLGAVRHHGFIPWDDDADIMMPRRDYERFMALFPERFRDRYGVGALSIDPEWNRQWGKIWDLHTRLVYKRYNNRDIGIFIDVYPVDGLPRTERGRRLFYFRQKVCAGLARDCVRNGDMPGLRFGRFRAVIRAFARLFGVRFFVERIDAIARKYDFDTSEYVACSVPVHYGSRETIRRELMACSTLLPFEGRMLPVPVGYDTYLSNLYGDYMKIPEQAAADGYTHLEEWEVEFDAEA